MKRRANYKRLSDSYLSRFKFHLTRKENDRTIKTYTGIRHKLRRTDEMTRNIDVFTNWTIGIKNN